MKFTAQEEYGLRCIMSLARTWLPDAPPVSKTGVPSAVAADADSHNFLTVRDVADKEGLSVQYAGKLFRILAKAGLVESVRGCKGGYRLSRAPEAIHTREVLAALGGKIYESKTCERYSGVRNFCVHNNDCSIRSLWAGLQLMIDTVLSQTTLRDLVGSEGSVSGWLRKHNEALAGLIHDLESGVHRSAGHQSAVRRSTGGQPRTASEMFQPRAADLVTVETFEHEDEDS